MNARHYISILAGALMFATACLGQQPTVSPRWTSDFVVVVGNDTITTERVRRTEGRLESDFVSRQQGIRIGIVAACQPDGLVSRLELMSHHVTDLAVAVPLQRLVIAFTRDSVRVSTGNGVPTQDRTLGVPVGTLPYLNLSAATLEQIFLRARALGGPTLTVPLFALAGGPMLTSAVRWIGADSAAVSIAGVELRAKVSTAGQLLGAIVPTQNVRFIRSAVPATSGR